MYPSLEVWRVVVWFSAKRDAVVSESKVAHTGTLGWWVVLAASPCRKKDGIVALSAVVEVAI